MARCGLVLANRRALKIHQKGCEICCAVKDANIKTRQLKVNNDPIHKNASSKAAKITSKRPEIIERRSAVLAKWREGHPDEFAKNTEAAQKAAKNRSKAEIWLSSYLGWKEGRIECGDTRKQVDLVSDKIWIEVDGFWHFFETKRKKDRRPSRLRNTLELRQSRDVILNEEVLKRGDVMLLRFSVECFNRRTGEMKEEWLPYLTAMLQSPKPGIWCHGKLYELVPWAKEGCTISKSPTPSTTSCCQVESSPATAMQSVIQSSDTPVLGSSTITL